MFGVHSSSINSCGEIKILLIAITTYNAMTSLRQQAEQSSQQPHGTENYETCEETMEDRNAKMTNDLSKAGLDRIQLLDCNKTTNNDSLKWKNVPRYPFRHDDKVWMKTLVKLIESSSDSMYETILNKKKSVLEDQEDLLARWLTQTENPDAIPSNLQYKYISPTLFYAGCAAEYASLYAKFCGYDREKEMSLRALFLEMLPNGMHSKLDFSGHEDEVLYGRIIAHKCKRLLTDSKLILHADVCLNGAFIKPKFFKDMKFKMNETSCNEDSVKWTNIDNRFPYDFEEELVRKSLVNLIEAKLDPKSEISLNKKKSIVESIRDPLAVWLLQQTRESADIAIPSHLQHKYFSPGSFSTTSAAEYGSLYARFCNYDREREMALRSLFMEISDRSVPSKIYCEFKARRHDPEEFDVYAQIYIIKCRHWLAKSKLILHKDLWLNGGFIKPQYFDDMEYKMNV